MWNIRTFWSIFFIWKTLGNVVTPLALIKMVITRKYLAHSKTISQKWWTTNLLNISTIWNIFFILKCVLYKFILRCYLCYVDFSLYGTPKFQSQHASMSQLSWTPIYISWIPNFCFRPHGPHSIRNRPLDVFIYHFGKLCYRRYVILDFAFSILALRSDEGKMGSDVSESGAVTNV